MTPELIVDTLAEMARQDTLKAAGRFKYTCGDPEMSDFEKFAVLGEEVGEIARALLDRSGLATDAYEQDLRKELIQVAAVALKWAQGIDRAGR